MLEDLSSLTNFHFQCGNWEVRMTLDKFLCWIFYVLNLFCMDLAIGPLRTAILWGAAALLGATSFVATGTPASKVTCELGLPRHWSYRHGRWRRIDGCQDIMLSWDYHVNYYRFIGILPATTTATMIVIISICFLFLCWQFWQWDWLMRFYLKVIYWQCGYIFSIYHRKVKISKIDQNSDCT